MFIFDLTPYIALAKRVTFILACFRDRTLKTVNAIASSFFTNQSKKSVSSRYSSSLLNCHKALTDSTPKRLQNSSDAAYE